MVKLVQIGVQAAKFTASFFNSGESQFACADVTIFQLSRPANRVTLTEAKLARYQGWFDCAAYESLNTIGAIYLRLIFGRKSKQKRLVMSRIDHKANFQNFQTGVGISGVLDNKTAVLGMNFAADDFDNWVGCLSSKPRYECGYIVDGWTLYEGGENVCLNCVISIFF